MSKSDRLDLASSSASAKIESSATDDRLARLTPREREVLALVVDGKTNKAIGEALGIAEGTVKSHIRQMMLTMRVKNRTQMALLAIGRF